MSGVLFPLPFGERSLQVCLLSTSDTRIQTTRSYHSNIRVSSQDDIVACSEESSRRGSHPPFQIFDHGRCFGGLCRWTLAWRIKRRDDQNRKRAFETVACGVEHELSKLGEGICDSARVLKSCSREDIVHIGEERGDSVL